MQLGDADPIILMTLLILSFDLKKEIHYSVEDSIDNRYGDKLTEFDV